MLVLDTSLPCHGHDDVSPGWKLADLTAEVVVSPAQYLLRDRVGMSCEVSAVRESVRIVRRENRLRRMTLADTDNSLKRIVREDTQKQEDVVAEQGGPIIIQSPSEWMEVTRSLSTRL